MSDLLQQKHTTPHKCLTSSSECKPFNRRIHNPHLPLDAIFRRAGISPIKLFYRKLHYVPILRHLCAHFTAGPAEPGFLMRDTTVAHFVSYDGVKLWATSGDVKRDETWDRCIRPSEIREISIQYFYVVSR